jgi:uncharacterized protein with PQ loop repeat
MELIGWLGSICFALCALPQAIHAYKTKSAEGITWGLLSLWFIGEILTIIYVLPKGYAPLLFNYISNIVLLSIIIYYKIQDRDKKK